MVQGDTGVTFDGEQVHDIVIIGGGPAGLSAATYGARAKLDTVVVDKNPAAGALGMASRIEAFPGLEKTVSGMELLSLLRRQAERFGAGILRAEVVAVDFSKNIKEVSTLGGPLSARTVIIATGAMGRDPGIPGEAKLIGRGVAYCAACDAAFFQDASVVMAGEAGLMLEELPMLAKFARKVYLVVPARGISPEQQELVSKTPQADLMLGHRLLEIKGEDSVAGVEVADAGGNRRSLDATGVFLYLYGRLPLVDFLHGAVDLSAEHCVRVDREDMSTSAKGVYAAGDVACRRFYQAVLSTADGCIAALSAQRYLSQSGGSWRGV